MAPPIHLSGRTPRRFLFAAIACATICRSAVAQSPSADESRIRAAMVFNLTRYVEWPSWKFVDASAPLNLCVLTNDPIGNDIDALIQQRQTRSAQLQDHALVLKRVASAASTESCHILYVSKLDRKKLIEAVPGLSKAGVLTIGDTSATEGAVIALPVIENRVQILVDLKAAQQSGLTLSSKLLKIATVTR